MVQEFPTVSLDFTKRTIKNFIYYYYTDAFAANFTLTTSTEQLLADFKETVPCIVEKQVPSKMTVTQGSSSWINTSIQKKSGEQSMPTGKERKQGRKLTSTSTS